MLANIKVMAIHHKSVLPYEPYNQVNTRKLRTHGDNTTPPAGIEPTTSP